MIKINKEEYWFLKGLDDSWKWIVKDNDTILWVYEKEPRKHEGWWDEFSGDYEIVDSDLFQFIRWDDGEPHNIQELIEEYENWVKDYEVDWDNVFGRESEETEVNNIEWLKDEVNRITNEYANENIFANYTRYMVSDIKNAINQLDEPEAKNITLQDITNRLWELPSNDRKHWLEQLNNEFQEGYIVPLGLKTTDGEEQYLTFNGSYFASRRKRGLQQTFATLEEIPEFYRDLAEKVL